MGRFLVRVGALFAVVACNQASGSTPAKPSAARSGDSVVYRLSHLSRLEVKTGKAGLFGFAGHEHMIRARGFSGRVVYFPDTPLRSHVEIRIATDSLEVITPPDTAEIRKVTEAMRTEVLHVDQHPEILFSSGALRAAEGGFRMTATLTMNGQAREVPMDLRVRVERDTIRATTAFFVNQTDFGIRPFRGGPGGTVRVADRVQFQIAAIAVRE